jgi:hypothetical protein
MKKHKSTPLKKNELDLEININEDTYDSAGKIINPNHLSKTQALNMKELKQLEKVLDSLVNSGQEHIAGKYLEGFLEVRSLSSLKDYLKNLE